MKRIRIIIFLCYIFAVLWITLFSREWGERKAMLTPFWEYKNVINGVGRDFYVRQIIGNLIMLMPFGFMLPMLKKIDMKRTAAVSLLFSAAIEATQYITGAGLMEFDDLFNNTVGAVMGYIVYDKLKEKCYGKI